MNRHYSSLLILFSSLAIIPALIIFFKGFHFGGYDLIIYFFKASLHPSLDKKVLISSLNGIHITLVIAFIAWLLSSTLGFIFGLFSSHVFSNVIGISPIFSFLIKRILTIPRSIHELIWALLLLQLYG